MNKWNELNERFISYAVCCLKIADQLPKTFAGQHISGQLTRCGTAPALHYGEVQSAESQADFVHKFKVLLKELRESKNCLKISIRMEWLSEEETISVINESDQLISISVKSIRTAQKSSEKKSKSL